MAINQDAIVQGIAVAVVNEVDKLMEALMALRDLQEWRDEAGPTGSIDFADYESKDEPVNTQILGENATHDTLKHLDGAMLNKCLGQVLGGDDSIVDTISHHLENTIVSGGPYNGKTYWEITQMVRRKKLRI